MEWVKILLEYKDSKMLIIVVLTILAWKFLDYLIEKYKTPKILTEAFRKIVQEEFQPILDYYNMSKDKDRYRDQMEIRYSKELNYIKNKKVKDFMIFKYNEITDTIIKIHGMNFKYDKLTIAKELLRNSNSRVKEYGIKNVGIEFINCFYDKKHDITFDLFQKEIEEIFLDKFKNDKHERLHVTTLNMIDKSLSDLFKIADQYDMFMGGEAYVQG